MAASVQCRRQERGLGMGMKEKDDDLALFLELQGREKENSDLLRGSDDLVDQIGSEQDNYSVSKMASTLPARKTDDFLNSGNHKTDYDWLLTPPGTPLFPSLEMEPRKTSETGISNGHAAAPKSSVNHLEEPPSENNKTSWQPLLSIGSTSSIAANGRPSSGGKLMSTGRGTLIAVAKPSRPSTPTSRAVLPATAKPSRPSTPTSRATLPAKSKPSRSSTPTSRATSPATSKPSRPSTPTSRATLPTTSKPSRPSTPTSRATLPATAKPSRPSTPPSRATFPSSKPAAPPVRSSTPTRSAARSSTPTARSSVPAASKSTSRSSTPKCRPSSPSTVTNASGPAGQSSLVMKSGTKMLKNLVPTRGTSPTMKSRPQKPSEMHGFLHDAPSNLKTLMPERPASASRVRPGAPDTQLSSIETRSNGKPRQHSCFTARERAPNGSVHNNGGSMLATSRAHSTGSDDVNPVLVGTKMVERVVNMRKLAPPKQDDLISKSNNSSGKSLSSQENSGFGRTLSKKSLDMALRHMDIRRSVASNLRPLVTNVPASSVYSVRSGSTKSKTVSAVDSPLGASSNASSEPSVNNNSYCLDGSEGEENYLGNETGHFSPASQHDE